MKNINLQKYTTLKIGGSADYFFSVKNEKELLLRVKFAKEHNCNFLVIGGGSNLLVSDNGYRGVVIKNETAGIVRLNMIITVKSGESLASLVNYANKCGLGGLELLAGIPGTVGGAIYGNAGAYGQTISDNLIRVKILDGEAFKWLPKNKCLFGYRDSLFKTTKATILEAEFDLVKASSKSLINKSKDTISLRRVRYPKGMLCPGSFFKNIVAAEVSKKVLERIPKDKVVYGKIPAGYLLETVGAKGAKMGSIYIASYHANLFVNAGGGTATDFYALAMKYKDKVEKKYNIKLEPEVQLVGF